LSRHGLVVLRYDKRSCGACYPGKLDTARFRYQHLLTDARDALDHLRERQDVDAGRIIVVGHSEGGQLAPHLARDASLAGAIMLAGSTGPLRGTLVGQLERLASMRLGRFDLLSYIQIRAQAAQFQSCFDALSGHFEDDEVCLGGGVTQRTLFEAEELFAQSMGIIERLEAPLCVIQGALDRNVLPENAFALRDALRTRDAEVHFVAGVGHSLVDGYHPDPPVLAPAVAEAIVGFVGSLRAGR
jgi:alpha-beta hydrolase superfamily lysophospholipase